MDCVGGRPWDACWLKVARVLTFWGFGGFGGFGAFGGFGGLGAGKRQAWTPIRSHGCGLGTPVGCEGLANGTLDRPEEAMDLALGLLLPALDAHKKPSMVLGV